MAADAESAQCFLAGDVKDSVYYLDVIMKIAAALPNLARPARLPAATPQSAGEVGATAAATAEDPQAKYLRNMQEGLQRLRAMPSPKKQARKDAQSRVGFLQRRMEALKLMLQHATPEQARALAKELKDIAGQLASAARSLGGSSGGGTQTVQAGATSSEATAEAEVQADTASVAELEAAAERSEDGKVQTPAATEVPLAHSADETTGNEDENDDAVLRGLLKDAKKLLKALIDMLKPKLAAADKEARDELHDAEKKLGEVDKLLQQSESPDCYGSAGSFSLAGIGLMPASSSGLNISVSV